MSKWVGLAKGFIPATPGYSSIAGDYAVAQALAAAGYRFKNGENVVLSAPFLTPTALHHVLRYLHTCRIEAMRGQLRAPWLNGPKMSQYKDLLVWTRASSQFSHLRKDLEIGAQLVGLNRSTGHLKQQLHHEKRLCRTIVCQQAGDLTEFCEVLSKVVRPFAVVIDATPFGCRENLSELLDHISEFFFGIPYVLLGTIGDQQLENELPRLVRKGAFWRQHLLDETPVKSDELKMHSLSLVNIPDHQINDRLLKCSIYCRELHKMLEHHIKGRKEVSSPLYKILGTLRALVVPIAFHEAILDQHRQGGLYPVRPIKDWLGSIARVNLPTGDVDNLRDKTITAIRRLMEMINTGSTGKAQALAHWLEKNRNNSGSSLIVTRSERESKYLKDWLTRDFAAELNNGKLAVLGAGSVRDCNRTLDSEFKQVLVLGQLWDSDRWALMLGEKVSWLSYPMESHWFQRVGRKVVAACQKEGEHKPDWWSFRPSPYHELPLKEAGVPEEEWATCTGKYVLRDTIEIDLPTDPDWISTLMADVEDQPYQAAQDDPPVLGELTIETGSGAFYRYGEGQQVYVLRDQQGAEKLKHVAAEDVLPGDTLVRLNGDDERCFSLVELMIDYAEGNTTEYRVFQSLVSQWHTYVDHAVHVCGGIEDLHRQLQSAGISITLESVRNWSRHFVIGPTEKKVVPLMARLGKIKHTEADIQSVQNAQRSIRGLHSQMGRRLRALAVAAKVGHIDIAGTADNIVSQDELVELVCVEEVVSIRHHKGSPKDPIAPRSLESILKSSIEQSKGRLVATQAALKSVVNSHYQNFDKVEQCLKVLSEYFYKVYANGDKIRLEDAIEEGKKYQIEFKGDSSDITKGKFQSYYERRYMGRKVDIGKHLGIGNSRNPERCFRLHFHWDKQEQKIVIHHAGRHLPTYNG